MESGNMSEEDITSLGEALMDLGEALEKIKDENKIATTVRNIRWSLDDLVDDVLDRMINPERWAEDVN